MQYSFKKGRVQILFLLLIALFFSSYLTSGMSATALESNGQWVLKETPTRQFLCASGMFCANPSAQINPGSANMAFGVTSPECAPTYEINSTWPDLPETLETNSSQNTPLSINVRQSVPCDAMIAEKADISLMFGKVVPPDTEPRLSYVGAAEVASFPVKGATESRSAAIGWTVPNGNTGETLHVRIATSLKSGLGGYVTYIYEYQGGNIQKTDTSPKPDDTADDVCAIGLRKSVLLFPPLTKTASARDSGARFSDFSGEVTVAPGSDPKNAEPAEMDMVLNTGSIIKTESESTAIISFADMTTFCMKPFTTVILDTPPEKESKMSLLAGKIWMNVKKMMQDGTMNVTMNQAVAGIKGTVLILEDTGSESILRVVDGMVEFSSKNNGTSVTVARGEMATASAEGPIAKQNFDVNAERANWQEFISRGGDDSTGKNGISVAAILWIIGITLVIGAAWMYKTKFAPKPDNERTFK